MKNLCDTCSKGFATCDAEHITFGIDLDPSARGAAADRVHACDAYEERVAIDTEGNTDAVERETPEQCQQ